VKKIQQINHSECYGPVGPHHSKLQRSEKHQLNQGSTTFW